MRGGGPVRGTDHRSRITRLLIRRALTELLRQKPLQSITVKELCEVAGINRGTFYAHYIDLYALREEMEGEMLQDFQQALSPLLEEEQPDERTPLKITAGIFQCLKDNAEVCTMTLGPYGDKAFAAKLINIGREKCVDSYRRYFTNASRKQLEYYYAFVSAGCIGLLEKWLSEGMTSSAEEVAEIAQGIMMSGVGFLGQAKGAERSGDREDA